MTSPRATEAQCVITYVHRDRRAAKEIARTLADSGYPCALNVEHMRRRRSITTTINELSSDFDVVLVLISNNYLEVSFTRSEWFAAQLTDARIIPIVLDGIDTSASIASTLPLDLSTVPPEAWRSALIAAIQGRQPYSASESYSDETFAELFSGKEPSGGKLRVSNVPSNQSDDVLARSQLLERLRSNFDRLHENSRRPIQVVMGSSGKSALAAAFASEFGREYNVTWWLRAGAEETLLSDLNDLLKVVGLKEDSTHWEASLLRFIEWSTREKAKWLLILDNADEVAQLTESFPSVGMGDIIITTRDRSVPFPAETLDVESLGPMEALQFITSHSGVRESQALEELIADLGGRTFALRQVSGLLRERVWKAARLRDSLRSWHRRSTRSDRTQPEQLISNLLDIALDSTGDQQETCERLLVTLATTGARTRVQDLYGISGWSESLINRSVIRLVPLGLVYVSDAFEVGIHPALSNYVFRRAGEIRTESEVKLVVHWLADRLPAGGGSVGSWRTANHLIPAAQAACQLYSQVGGKDLAAAKVAYRIGQFQDLKGDRHEAGRAYWLALNLLPESAANLGDLIEMDFRRIFPEDPARLAIAAALGREGGSFVEVEQRRRAAGSLAMNETPDLRSAKYAQAVAHLGRGKYAKAQSALKDVLGEERQARGAAHPASLRVQLALAASYVAAGDLDHGAAVSRQSLELAEMYLGTDSELAAQSGLLFAYCTSAMGRKDEALAVATRAVETLRRLGVEDPFGTSGLSEALLASLGGATESAEKGDLPADGWPRTGAGPRPDH